ncbi:uncharacterized protein LOC130296207 [Hyla sarda]|uniref:uncharacterized protein LOC130296207 n=1 Tax=Hyla sarda TaxID=327740 RepID=UPI0024C452E8|nr:uncharacterized protein LOC130296207 [Hyla sarda]
MVADAVLVSLGLGDGCRLSENMSTVSISPSGSCRRVTSVSDVRSVKCSSVADIGASEPDRSLSQSTRDLIHEAWAPGTRSAYRSAWGLWVHWCSQRQMDPIHAPIADVLNFLSEAFNESKAYRTINVYRSAISAQHSAVDGRGVGQHQLICRLLKGIRLKRPPGPRYQITWDVSLVLRMFSYWEDNDVLSLKLLSYKLTMFLCLVSIKRVSDGRALDISGRQFTPQGVQSSITRRTKTNLRTVFYPFFPSHPLLCVVRCLKAYELKTEGLRSKQFSQLLISFCSPYLPVSSPTLARWVKQSMALPGVDVSFFKAHSSRGAMATKVAQTGGSLSEKLKAADWSSEDTFRTFYFRPEGHVAMSVL